MPKFRVAVRDRATIDVIAYAEVEADTPEAAVERLETEDWDLEFEADHGLGWFDREYEQTYSVYDVYDDLVEPTNIASDGSYIRKG